MFLSLTTLPLNALRDDEDMPEWVEYLDYTVSSLTHSSLAYRRCMDTNSSSDTRIHAVAIISIHEYAIHFPEEKRIQVTVV